MQTYKLTEDEFDLIKRWDDSRKSHIEAAKAFQSMINGFMQDTILPKLNVVEAPGTAVSVEINFRSKEVSVEIKSDPKIFVPGATGQIKDGKKI